MEEVGDIAMAPPKLGSEEKKQLILAIQEFVGVLCSVNQSSEATQRLMGALQKLNDLLGHSVVTDNFAGEVLNKTVQPIFKDRAVLTSAEFDALKRKFHKAVKANKLAKAALVASRFYDGISSLSQKAADKKKALFYKGIVREIRLEILKKQYQLAVIEDEERKAEILAGEFFSLAPDERKKELSQTTHTVIFLERKIALLERKAAAFEAFYDSEKTQKDFDEERTCLEKLVKTLITLKEMTVAQTSALEYPKEISKSGQKQLSVDNLANSSQVRRLYSSPRPNEIRQSASFPKLLVKQAFFVSKKQYDGKVVCYQKRLEKLNASACVSELNDEDFDKKVEEAQLLFQGVLRTFVLKGSLSNLFHSRGKSFAPSDYVSGLMKIAEIFGRGHADIVSKNTQFLKGLIKLFRMEPQERLVEWAEEMKNHPYRNFYRAVEHYLGSNDEGVLNILALGLPSNSDGLNELGPLAELQTLNSYFVEAFHRALELRQISYKNRFAVNDIVSCEQVLSANRAYLRDYVVAGAGRYETAKYKH